MFSCLTMHFECLECSVQVQGFFDEAGMTGMRDAMVYAMLSNEGKVKATDMAPFGTKQKPALFKLRGPEPGRIVAAPVAVLHGRQARQRRSYSGESAQRGR